MSYLVKPNNVLLHNTYIILIILFKSARPICIESGVKLSRVETNKSMSPLMLMVLINVINDPYAKLHQRINVTICQYAMLPLRRLTWHI